MDIKRRNTRTISIGKKSIGYGYPIAVQSMTKTDTSDILSTVKQINELERYGCDLIRVAVKFDSDAMAVKEIKKEINIPIVADIHFDHKLALLAIERGADKIRINPGNMAREKGLDEVISAAKSNGIPVRIGVNSGSVSSKITAGKDMAHVMVKKLNGYVDHFRAKGFDDLVLSLKSAEVLSTIEAYRKVAAGCDLPLHLGVTAAGLPGDGIVKSCVGIGALLLEGIGDTFRVSITGDPSLEVQTAVRILEAIGERSRGPRVIACPTCGRCQVDLVAVAEEVESRIREKIDDGIYGSDRTMVIAVMGCEVNGPGEAKNADIGIAFGKDKGMIFSDGETIKVVTVDDAVDELMKLIEAKII